MGVRDERAEAEERDRIVRRIRRGVAELGDGQLERIAASLGVPLAAVRAMPGVFTAYDGDTGECYDGFPMQSPVAAGAFEWGWCGWSRRYTDGRKKSVGKAGLFLPGVQPAGDVLYVVEGYSDVLAMVGAGLPAVGRPSNIAGSDLIVRYVAGERGRWSAVVVVAENDEKPDGLWPGGTGAVTVADRVRAGLKQFFAKTDRCVPVFVRRMPGVVKDPRQWFAAKGYNSTAVNSLVGFLTAGINYAEAK